MAKQLLGQILLERGVITEVQLTDALNDQKTWGGKIGQVLIRMSAITEEQLVDFLSYQLGISKIDFTKSPITMEALQLVPKAICSQYCLIPVAKKDQGSQKRLLVAFADPLDFEAVRQAEFTSNCVVSAVLGSEKDIRNAIDYCYRDEGLRECTEGLPCLDQIDLDSVQLPDEEAVIFTQDGRELMVGMESRGSDAGLRALVDLLVDKGYIKLEEFRERLDKIKQEES